MMRVLQSLLAFVSLILLAFMAARANSAEWQLDPAWQGSANAVAAPAGQHARLGRHCLLAPGLQPETHLQGQPFAYGYFGAHARPAPVFHRSSNGDWFQWTIIRAD